MRTELFFQHHGVGVNPFADEDAQTDPVFKNRCLDNTFHPAWDKVYGDPDEPATSIVFGEKGAGKTALRLQIMARLAKHNRQPGSRGLWVVEYDDLNPFLDHFAERLPARKQRDASRVLAAWKLWDHMDAILSLGVTDLVDRLLDSKTAAGPEANRLPPGADAAKTLDDAQKRDLLLLAACYDNSTAEAFTSRWGRLRRKLRYLGVADRRAWRVWGEWGVGAGAAALIAGVTASTGNWGWLRGPWPYVMVLAAWLPWLWKWGRRGLKSWGVAGSVRAIRRDAGALQTLLMRLPADDLLNQPLPDRPRTDDRYELLGKLQGVLHSLGVVGLVVLVDRVDEPHLLGGKTELMRDFVWSMLDNKFLKQPGVGVKLLLPEELAEHLHRETRDFHQRARIDKQNLVPSLDWTGEALFDLANARLAACASEERAREGDGGPGARDVPGIRDMFDATVSQERLVDAFRSLRTPRHLFKFLYRLIATHAAAHTETQPVWRVSRDTFESVLAVYGREQAAVDRGLSG